MLVHKAHEPFQNKAFAQPFRSIAPWMFFDGARYEASPSFSNAAIQQAGYLNRLILPLQKTLFYQFSVSALLCYLGEVKQVYLV